MNNKIGLKEGALDLPKKPEPYIGKFIKTCPECGYKMISVVPRIFYCNRCKNKLKFNWDILKY